MTCRERLEIEHPDCVDEFRFTGGCEGCPSTYDYLDDPNFCDSCNAPNCKACWDREIPEEKDENVIDKRNECGNVYPVFSDEILEPAKGMTTETFNKLLDELDGNSLETLKQKNAKYASPTDCLHNFDSGADIMGSTPAQCAWGYMTKHLVALRDKVQKNDFSDRDDLLEKCQDIINYIRFIWLIGNEEERKKNE